MFIHEYAAITATWLSKASRGRWGVGSSGEGEVAIMGVNGIVNLQNDSKCSPKDRSKSCTRRLIAKDRLFVSRVRLLPDRLCSTPFSHSYHEF